VSNKPGIWAVILAAGESKRMNGPKLILPYGKSTIIAHLIENILESEIDNIMVVLGGWRDELGKAIKDLPVSSCYNGNYRSGMLSSVICGIDSLPPDAGAAMIIPGDQPGITPDVINSLIRTLNETGRGIIVAVHKGKRGHPVLISRKFFDQIRDLDPDIGLRDLLSKSGNEVYEVETGDNKILMDIDTNKDYLEAINKSKQR